MSNILNPSGSYKLMYPKEESFHPQFAGSVRCNGLAWVFTIGGHPSSLNEGFVDHIPNHYQRILHNVG